MVHVFFGVHVAQAFVPSHCPVGKYRTLQFQGCRISERLNVQLPGCTRALRGFVIAARGTEALSSSHPSCQQARLDSYSNDFAAPSQPRRARAVIATMAAILVSTSVGFVHCTTSADAAQQKLPPIDRSDSTRCTPKSSSIGQANAARDTLLDLRECDLRNRDLQGYDLSGAVMERAILDGSNFQDAQLSKAYAANASFKESNFTNAVVDRVDFSNSDLKGAVFANAVLSDAVFDGANLADTDWTDAYVGDFTQRAICRNPSLQGENPNGNSSRESLGCR